MDETTWLGETDPLRLLAARYPMRGHDSTLPQPRQSRLYLLACARRQWARLPTVLRAVVWLGEEYADAPRKHERIHSAVAPLAERLMGAGGTPDEMRAAELDLRADHVAPESAAVWRAATAPTAPADPSPPAVLRGVATLLHLAFDPLTPAYTWVPPELHSLVILRDVLGNPYRHTPFRSAWRTDTAKSLARQMYADREFGAMPILADALQDAGCDNETVLGHLRDPHAAHVRGCWVLDLVLKK